MGLYSDNNVSLVRRNITPVMDGAAMPVAYPPYASLFYPYLLDNGGNVASPSLTIDTVNNPNDVLGVSFVIQQTSNPYCQTHLGNAYAFSNQQLTVYIARNKQISDSRDGVYTNTKLRVTMTNLLTGISDVVKEFDDFDSDLNSPARYFTIDLPSLNNSLYALYGLYGACVLSLDTDIELYGDSRFKAKLGVIEGHHYRLQMSIYSAANEARYVTSPIPIFKDAVIGNETYDVLFFKSLMDNYNGQHSVPLNNAQRRASICDQLAVLFMSQHPVLTCDVPPSPVLGIGCQELYQTTYMGQSSVYSQKYSNIDMVLDRRFGLPIGYTTFGYSKEIEQYFVDNNQSQQILKDPCRILSLKTDGTTNRDFGIDGILFNPYVVKHVNAEMCLPQTMQCSLMLSNSSASVSSMRITNADGSPIVNSTDFVRVSVSFTKIVQQIQYTIWTHNTSNLQTYLDLTGNGVHVFNLSVNGGVVISRANDGINSDGSLIRGDVVTVQVKYVDIDDVSGVFSQEFFVPSTHLDPAIVDITAYQVPDGTGAIQVAYRYDGGAEINNTMINLFYSLDRSTWALATSVTGDVGLVMPGLRTMRWLAASVLPVSTKTVWLQLASQDVANGVVDVDDEVDKGCWRGYSKIVSVEFAQPLTALRRLSEIEIQQMEIGMYSSSLSSVSSASSLSSVSPFSESSRSSASSVTSTSSVLEGTP